MKTITTNGIVKKSKTSSTLYKILTIISYKFPLQSVIVVDSSEKSPLFQINRYNGT